MIQTNPAHPDYDLGLEILACIPSEPNYVGLQDICTDFQLESQVIALAALSHSRAGKLLSKYKIRRTNVGKGLGRGLCIRADKWPAARDAALAYLAKNAWSLPEEERVLT